jgi:hypothetical protein
LAFTLFKSQNEKTGFAENGNKLKEVIFLKQTSRQKSKGVLLTCYNEKFDRRWPVKRNFEVQ